MNLKPLYERIVVKMKDKQEIKTEAGNQEIPGFCRDVPSLPRCDVAHFRTVRRGQTKGGEKCGLQYRTA